ncbi:hypothetical protein NCS57_00336100 [Fusarium keratoplasticum]|uniref:Uncharacterized protein n=1 Tax=Fusarium keratoplasticum TaxID=1328300 RepID=A0ACC0RBA4_9HYPO|nr:hypothetical protein NCS57_00336100 [Fusarium keratoplasticum]KAI8680545.1 hypothetical protein NCS57_00336100 [Fusarium keratoplasticum]
MDNLTQYQVTEAYLMSGLSFFSIYLFALLKGIYSWSRKTPLLCFQVCVIAGWSMLETTALILFSLEHSQPGKLPGFLAGSTPTVLDVMSFWGAAIVQIMAIIYPFAVGSGKEWCLECLFILECLEVTVITIFVMVPETPTPLQLAYVAPFTSQAATIGFILFASRRVPSEGTSKPTADYLSILSLLLILVSALLLGLSLAGYYTASMLPQWLLYIMGSVLGYRPPEAQYRRRNREGDNSELEMNPSRELSLSDSAYNNQSSASLDGDRALLSDPALPPPAVMASSNRLHLSESR